MAGWGRTGLFVGIAAVTACGLELVGTPYGDPLAMSDASTNDGSARDASAVRDAKGPCTPTVVDDAFTDLDTLKWYSTTNDPGYPAVLSPPLKGPSMAALLAPNQNDRRGGLWLARPVPMLAFDVKFNYLVACPDSGACGDGIAAVWLDTTKESDLHDASLGDTLGVPRGQGVAVTVSLFLTNASTSTDEILVPPSLSVVAFTADQGPPHGKVSTLPIPELVGQRRTVKLRYRDGELSVSDGEKELRANVVPPDLGFFGFTAATGGASGSFYVSSFRGEFYSCEP